MPLPFSHIVYADKILQTKLKNHKINKQEYFIGATYPDIRYLAKLPREKTHLLDKTPTEIWQKIKQEKDSFKLGILIHQYLDQKTLEYRQQYFQNILQISNSYYPILILNDQILFNSFTKINSILKYYDKILDKEIKHYNLNKKIIANWHKVVKKYSSKKLTKKVYSEASKLLGFDEQTINNILNDFDKIKNNKKIIQKIKNFENIL